MNIFGAGLAVLGGVYALVVGAVTASEGGKRQNKPSKSLPESTDEQNSNQDS